MCPLIDTAKTWIVAKDGNDGNSGHPDAYPIVTAGKAYLTIQQAVDDAVAGDNIIIFPGSYDETVTTGAKSLNFYGMNKYNTKIFNETSGSGLIVSSGADGTSIRNLNFATVESGANYFGIDLYRALANITIEDCITFGHYDGIKGHPDNENLQIRRTVMSSNFDGAVILGKGFVVTDCIFRSASSAGHGNALITGGHGVFTKCSLITECATDLVAPSGLEVIGITDHENIVFNDCQVYAANSHASSVQDTAGVKVLGVISPVSRLLFNNCSVLVSGAPNGMEVGVQNAVNGGMTQLTNCQIENRSTGDTNYSLKNDAGKMIVGASYYDTALTSGTITRITPDVDASGQAAINEAAIITALKAATGFTAGNSWTYAALMKVWAAFLTGKKQLKSGETNVYEFLDPDDGTTKVLEMTVSDSTPYFQFTVL